MKVAIKGVGVFDPEEHHICLVLTEHDRSLVAGMHADATMLAYFPDSSALADVEQWMDEVKEVTA